MVVEEGWCGDGLALTTTSALGVQFALLWMVWDALGWAALHWAGPWCLLPGGECLISRSIEEEEAAATAVAWSFTTVLICWSGLRATSRDTRGADESATPP